MNAIGTLPIDNEQLFMFNSYAADAYLVQLKQFEKVIKLMSEKSL